MPTPLDQQKALYAQRIAGGSPGGMQMPSSPPPAGMVGQEPSGGPPQNSEAEPHLQRALQIIVRGNPADLAALGRFEAQIRQLIEEHTAGQATPTAVGYGTP